MRDTMSKEMALRLAYYLRKYGGIPEMDLAKLYACAMGSPPEGWEDIPSLADDIHDYFSSMKEARE